MRLEAGSLSGQSVSPDIGGMAAADFGLGVSARDEERGASQREGTGPE